MQLSQRTKFFTLWVFLFGLSNISVLAQGKGRLIRVRKTGEFGKRIASISTFYQPPPRQFDANHIGLQTSETRRSDNVIGIKKPSQSLQLPFYNPPDPDQEAEETGESIQGYAYPNPEDSTTGGYSYNNKPPAISEFSVDLGKKAEEEYEADPAPVTPDREAEIPNGSNFPLKAEAEENIDAEGLASQDRSANPVRPDSPEAELPAKCDENDDNCWPHGYKGEIPGEAGQDYPILSEIFDTNFDCNNVKYSGYYADTDEQARCQMFHVCLKGNQYRSTQKWSFLCPNGTVFSQNDFVCVWWNSAPECNSGVIDELSIRNAELGWDNLTENESRNTNFNVKTAMSSLANVNLQSSSSNSRLKNTLPQQSTTTRRPSTPSVNFSRQQSSNPYRIPVKVNTGTGERTELKEVAHNSLQGQEFGVEHDGEESETYETSLRHQSEARHKTKSGSALSKSESEAYEQKSVADSVNPAPFIVARGSGQSNSGLPEGIPQQGPYEDEEEVSSVVMMMPTQQRNPDGSESYAEVPVLMQGNGYRYPNPTSTPGPAYLPPRKEYSPPSTTESPTSTFLPVSEDSIDPEGVYQYQTTEIVSDVSFSPQFQESTTEKSGYNYPSPTTTEKDGYNYPSPTTTEKDGYNYPSPTTTEKNGYNYPSPTTTEKDGYNYEAPRTTEQSGYNYEVPSTTEQNEYKYPSPTTTEAPVQVTEEEEYNSSPVFEGDDQGGYGYDSTTVAQIPISTTTEEQQNYTPVVTTISSTTSQVPEGGYLPPKSQGGYDYPQSTAGIQSGENILSISNTEASEQNDKEALEITGIPDAPESLPTIEGNEVVGEGGYSNDKDSTVPYPIPTPSSNIGDTTPGANLDSEDKVSQILKQIQAGGAEVRDENGNKIDYAELQKLILSTPNGHLALQKAEDTTSIQDSTNSSGSPSTESSSTTIVTEETPTSPINSENETPIPEIPIVSPIPTLETVQPIEDYIENRRVPIPVAPQSQQGYYSNNQAFNTRNQNNYEIRGPSSEFENHSVEQNSIDTSGLQGQQQQQRGGNGGIRNSFSGYSSSYETQRLSNQQTLGGSINQNFASLSQLNPSGGNSLLFQAQQPQSQQQQFRVQQSQTQQPDLAFIRPSKTQTEQYYQNQQQSQSNVQSQPQRSSYYDQQANPVQQSNPQSYFQSQPQSNPIQNQIQQSFFQAQTQSSSNQYLPPVPSTSQAIYRETSTADKFRSAVALQRDLSQNIQLQQSYNVQIPQASSTNRKLVNPADIKIVPALFVHQHTRVENPDGSPIDIAAASQRSNNFQRPTYQQSPRNLNRQSNINNGFGHFNVQASQSAYLPYASQNIPVTVKAPRLDSFSFEDALPNYEPFTANDGRTKEQIQQYRQHSDLRKYQRRGDQLQQQSQLVTSAPILPTRRRNGMHFIGGPRGQLELAGEDQRLISNFYPGRDHSRGVSLTYN